ncbi:MAG: hypothetical protein IIC35_05065 [Gemmatimonadetes bacterium]|nr:hypothetical protein [Gemmatimonadota bacterium]
MRRLAQLAVLTATVLGAAPIGVSGQLARQVAEVADGFVRFSYATRQDVEICDDGIRVAQRHVSWRSRSYDDGARDCRVGFVEVELDVRRGLVRDVEIVRTPDDRHRGARDFGEVTPGQAVEFLLSLAYSGATDHGAKEAILPATLADVDDTWQELLDMARDRTLEQGVRTNTLFWLGQEAATAATQGLADVALDVDEGQEIRNSAIFALSQRAPRESVPILIEVARSGEQAGTRRTAMFWLAQSGDERVVAFFEEILLGRVR